MRTGDYALWAVGAGAALIVAGILLFGALFVFTFFTGTYRYEYRCTDNVAERRLEWWGFLPVGGFENIDGDPVGGCKDSP